MIDNLNYMYFGNSLKDSLKEFGMVCRKEKSDQYYFIYKVNEGYEEGFIRDLDIVEFMNGQVGYSNQEVKEFLLNTARTTHSEFMKLPILEKVLKLSNHFGVETILGKSIAPLTLAVALNIIEKE